MGWLLKGVPGHNAGPLTYSRNIVFLGVGRRRVSCDKPSRFQYKVIAPENPRSTACSESSTEHDENTFAREIVLARRCDDKRERNSWPFFPPLASLLRLSHKRLKPVKLPQVPRDYDSTRYNLLTECVCEENYSDKQTKLP